MKFDKNDNVIDNCAKHEFLTILPGPHYHRYRMCKNCDLLQFLKTNTPWRSSTQLVWRNENKWGHLSFKRITAPARLMELYKKSKTKN